MQVASKKSSTKGRFPISRYLNVRSSNYPTFSSDGASIAFISDITGVPQVWQVPLAESGVIPWPDQLTFENDRVMGVWHSPTEAGLLIYARDMGGNENAQLFLLAPGEGQEVLLIDGFDGAMHTFGAWSHSGDVILFAANRRNPSLFDLYLQPLDGEARMVWQNDAPGFFYNMSFSPDDNRALLTLSSSSFHAVLLEVDLAAATSCEVSPQGEATRYDSTVYAPNGRAAYVVTDFGTNLTYLGKLDLEKRSIEPVATPNSEVELLAISRDGKLLAYCTNRDGASALYVLDVESGETYQAGKPGPKPGVVGANDAHLDFSPDARFLAYSYSAATRAPNVYLWDFRADTVTAVTRSSHAGLPEDAFVTPQLVHFPTFDEVEGATRQIPAWLYMPADSGDAPVPAVVVVHGGPEGQYRLNFQFLAQYLANSGYAVLAPNVRGSTGYGKAYSHLDDVRRRMDSVADLAAAARWLKQQPGIDGDHLAVYGGSYGGFMVLSALTTYPDLWAAAVDIVGISNFVTFLEKTSGYRRAHREAEYGSLAHDRDFLLEISPLSHADKIIAPLMVLHGANDPRVPVGEARQLVAVLEARHVPVELTVFDDEGHGIVKLKNKLVAYPAIIEFLDRYLGQG